MRQADSTCCSSLLYVGAILQSGKQINHLFTGKSVSQWMGLQAAEQEGQQIHDSCKACIK